MTRDRIEPIPDTPGHDGPCQDCAQTYRRTMMAGAIAGAILSAVGMVLAAALAKAIG